MLGGQAGWRLLSLAFAATLLVRPTTSQADPWWLFNSTLPFTAFGGALGSASALIELDASAALLIDSATVTIYANSTGPFTLSLAINVTEPVSGAPSSGVAGYPTVESGSFSVPTASLRKPFNVTFSVNSGAKMLWPPLIGGRYAITLSCVAGCAAGVLSPLSWVHADNASATGGPLRAVVRGDRIAPVGSVRQSTMPALSWGMATRLPALALVLATRVQAVLVDTTARLQHSLGTGPAAGPWPVPQIYTSTTTVRAIFLLHVDNTTAGGWPTVKVESATLLVHSSSYSTYLTLDLLSVTASTMLRRRLPVTRCKRTMLRVLQTLKFVAVKAAVTLVHLRCNHMCYLRAALQQTTGTHWQLCQWHWQLCQWHCQWHLPPTVRTNFKCGMALVGIVGHMLTTC